MSSESLTRTSSGAAISNEIFMDFSRNKLLTQQIKAEAMSLGFSACGVSKAEPVAAPVADAFRRWIVSSHHAGMAYMENWTELRLNPCLLMEGCRSVVSLAMNYYPQRRLRPDQYQFSYYAYGRDYHDVMKHRMRVLQERISALATEHLPAGSCAPRFRLCCDTAPILDRYWAWRSGLGWIGKNTNLIIPSAGSYFFLGEILVDIDLDYDTPLESRCGTCTACLRACPTHALERPYELDARRCLSYLTIENRGPIPDDLAHCLGHCIYGCDRCQQACPHNRSAVPTAVDELMPSDRFLSMDRKSWQSLTPDAYREIFRGSAVKRAKYEGLMRNIEAVAQADS